MTPPNNKSNPATNQPQTSPGRDATGPNRMGDPQQPTPRTPGADPARHPQGQGKGQPPNQAKPRPGTPELNDDEDTDAKTDAKVDTASKQSFPASDASPSHKSTGADDADAENDQKPM